MCRVMSCVLCYVMLCYVMLCVFVSILVLESGFLLSSYFFFLNKSRRCLCFNMLFVY